jgi:hypothetical protein
MFKTDIPHGRRTTAGTPDCGNQEPSFSAELFVLVDMLAPRTSLRRGSQASSVDAHRLTLAAAMSGDRRSAGAAVQLTVPDEVEPHATSC